MENDTKKEEKNMARKWTCPYCNRPTTINSNDYARSESILNIKNVEGPKYLQIDWVVCPNDECERTSLEASLFNRIKIENFWNIGSFIRKWTLLPDTKSKIFPDYIPIGILQDYEEAYAISELSPKASATLARRCIEGIIKDFWGIKKSRLVDAINELEEKIDPLTWQAIDSIRKIGNIGAHMEKDVNLIITVEPDEAHMLIQLIEMLFTEWYIYRHEREVKLKEIVAIADKKKAEKKKKL